MTDKTIQFSINEDSDAQMKAILGEVYEALNEKGYNPISQIVGYILSEDPTLPLTTMPEASSERLTEMSSSRHWYASS